VANFLAEGATHADYEVSISHGVAIIWDAHHPPSSTSSITREQEEAGDSSPSRLRRPCIDSSKSEYEESSL
jgi:hypothetical protein